MALSIVRFEVHRERIVVTEACHVEKLFLVTISGRGVLLPWAPFFHNPKELELAVSLTDELLDEARCNFFLNFANILGFINDFHAESGKLSTIEFIGVLIWQLLDFLQDQVV